MPNYVYGGTDEFQLLVKMANAKSIHLIGINKDSQHLLDFGFNEKSDKVELMDVSGVTQATVLDELPDSVISSISGKTIFFSTQEGRGLSIVNYEDVKISDSIVLEQPIERYYLIHEIGHFVYLDKNKVWSTQSANYSTMKNLFEIDYERYSLDHAGFMTSYALTNQYENFAEHFAQYVTNGEEFRHLANSDALLESKYDFLKNYIFSGIEY